MSAQKNENISKAITIVAFVVIAAGGIVSYDVLKTRELSQKNQLDIAILQQQITATQQLATVVGELRIVVSKLEERIDSTRPNK